MNFSYPCITFLMKRNASRDHNFQVRWQKYEVHLSERNLTAPLQCFKLEPIKAFGASQKQKQPFIQIIIARV